MGEKCPASRPSSVAAGVAPGVPKSAPRRKLAPTRYLLGSFARRSAATKAAYPSDPGITRTFNSLFESAASRAVATAFGLLGPLEEKRKELGEMRREEKKEVFRVSR